jgi:hypothetical protein
LKEPLVAWGKANTMTVISPGVVANLPAQYGIIKALLQATPRRRLVEIGIGTPEYADQVLSAETLRINAGAELVLAEFVILTIIWRRILRINWRERVTGQGHIEDGNPPPWRSEA